MKVTGETSAWLLPFHQDADLSDGASLVGNISLSEHDMTDVGWIKIGRATVTIDLCIDQNGLNAEKVKRLQDQLADMSAKYEAARTEILRRISQLTALPNESPNIL